MECRNRSNERGFTLLAVLVLLALLSAAGGLIYLGSQQHQRAERGFSTMQHVDIVLMSLAKEARDLIAARYETDYANLMADMAASNPLLSTSQSLERFHRTLKDYTFNFFLSDNDDGDADLGIDLDGKMHLEVRVWRGSEVIRRLDSFVEVQMETNYGPKTVAALPAAFGACYDGLYKNFNVKIDLDNEGGVKKIKVNGNNHLLDGTPATSDHKKGLASNGTFGEPWYENNVESLPQVSGLETLVGADAVLELDWIKVKCKKYRGIEYTVKYDPHVHHAHQVVKITPETTTFDLTGKKLIEFDASGGGKLSIAPPVPGQPIVLGTMTDPVVVVVKGKYPRCTAQVAVEALCNYAEGDGVIEFLGPVEGYGVFIQDGSVDVSGDFTWGGYFQAMARSDEEDPDQELGRVFEVHGDATITGGVLFNMPKGYATLGDLDPDPFNNYGFVARGEDSTIRYSQEALELAAEGLTTITRRITRLYAFHIFHID
ncbi:MAG: hypothetical protein A2284_04230 [Deltaproteobacteria bacterium RIFOXYA12_FULL_61_11]|nr:MAG: hypothetical protein A2284_04230 [Deltaproteobacteria bacterium RIFOXYA12_FULL_61_11]